MSGVFGFAMLIGQIQNILDAHSASKMRYRRIMDGTLHYMHDLNLPKDLQEKVRLWFNYTWEHQKTLSKGPSLKFNVISKINFIAKGAWVGSVDSIFF